MNTLLLALSMAVLGSHAAPPDAITGFVSVRSDAQGRIQVVVDHDDESPYTAYLFQPAEPIRPIPAAIYKAIVVKSAGRLTVDGLEGQPLHLDLYLPTSKGASRGDRDLPLAATSGTGPTGIRGPTRRGIHRPDLHGHRSAAVGGRRSRSDHMLGRKGREGFRVPGRRSRLAVFAVVQVPRTTGLLANPRVDGLGGRSRTARLCRRLLRMWILLGSSESGHRESGVPSVRRLPQTLGSADSDASRRSGTLSQEPSLLVRTTARAPGA